MSKKSKDAQFPIQASSDAVSHVTSIPMVKAAYFVVPTDVAGQKRRMVFSDDETTMELCCVFNACFLRVRSNAGVELIPACHVLRLVVGDE